jgi:hypothetical protein
MNTYTAKYRRVTDKIRVWTKVKNLIGHKWFQEQNKMVFYFKDGSLKEVAKWTDCEIHLAKDWVLWTKEQMEREANQSIKLNVET